jgi:N6-L-threonylcarbamoyladenine synthase
MLVLGIESTCDETACSVVRNGKDILSNVIASQNDIHAKYGGVFPELASRRHIDVIIPVIDQALNQANVELREIDLIAVAYGPGLLGSILVGLNAAKTLALALNKPLVPVNHVEAHLYAALMPLYAPPFPCIGVVLSGAHTNLLKIKDIGQYEVLGQTVDDAIGEAFDKAAKIMDLPYPGGPHIEILARSGNLNRYQFKAGKVKERPLDFSFSGIKTGVLYAVRGQNGTSEKSVLSLADKCDIAASFQEAVFSDVINKTLKTAKNEQIHTIVLGGGVTNNQRLRNMFKEAAPEYNILWPLPGLSLDNAAMIAGLGYHRYKILGGGVSLDIDAATRMNF